jgi:hypothetical protein
MMQDCVAFTKKANWFSYVKLMGLQIISMQQESGKVLSKKLMNAICSNTHVFDILPIDIPQYAVAENISTEGHLRIRIHVTGKVQIILIK